MNPFTPTHEIRITAGAGKTRRIPVQHVDGALYTREEWDSDSAADWELSTDDDGEDVRLTFQGKPASGFYLEPGQFVALWTVEENPVMVC